jgi:hypothetical protein
LVVLSFFQVAVADFSFAPEEAAPDAAQAGVRAAVLVQAPVGEAAEAVAAGALAVEPVAAAAAAGPAELVCSEVAEALAADEPAVEPVADAAAVGSGLACSEAAEGPAVDAVALAAEPVVDAGAEGPERACSELAVAPAAGVLAAELVADAVAAAELVVAQEQALAAHLVVRRAVDCDSAEHFAELAPIAGPRPVDGLRLAVAGPGWVVVLR